MSLLPIFCDTRGQRGTYTAGVRKSIIWLIIIRFWRIHKLSFQESTSAFWKQNEHETCFCIYSASSLLLQFQNIQNRAKYWTMHCKYKLQIWDARNIRIMRLNWRSKGEVDLHVKKLRMSAELFTNVSRLTWFYVMNFWDFHKEVS